MFENEINWITENPLHSSLAGSLILCLIFASAVVYALSIIGDWKHNYAELLKRNDYLEQRVGEAEWERNQALRYQLKLSQDSVNNPVLRRLEQENQRLNAENQFLYQRLETTRSFHGPLKNDPKPLVPPQTEQKNLQVIVKKKS